MTSLIDPDVRNFLNLHLHLRPCLAIYLPIYRMASDGDIDIKLENDVGPIRNILGFVFDIGPET